MKIWNRLKMVAASTAVFGATVLGAHAHALTAEQFEIIQELIATNNAQALREFLRNNPELLDSSRLGQDLQEFVSSFDEDPGFFSRRAAFGSIRQSVIVAEEDTSSLVPIY